jgi:hypothetical protein
MKIKSILIVILFVAFQTSNAQFEASKNYLGPSLGLSFLGSTFQIGVNYEHGLNLNSIGMSGSGKLGVGGLFRYWGYSEDFFGGKWSYTNILIGAQGNYHFEVSGGKLDPYLGLVLAYDIGTVDWDGVKGAGWAERTSGGFWLGLQGGLRYFFTPKLALNARLGLGTLSYSSLEVGVDFTL